MAANGTAGHWIERGSTASISGSTASKRSSTKSTMSGNKTLVGDGLSFKHAASRPDYLERDGSSSSWRGFTCMVSEYTPPRKAWYVGTAIAGVIGGVMATLGALVDWSAPAAWTPPLVVHSLTVVVEGGAPAKVVEHRTIERAFPGEWATRVVALRDGVPRVVCKQPLTERGYGATYVTAGESFLSLPFDDYIGDAGECRARIAKQPGSYLLVVERHDWTGGVDRPLALVSSPTFEVGP